MVGIYKITSPLGKVYIGQSINIELRFRWYAIHKKIVQPLIQRSLKKYGIDNHKFEIIHELPSDVDKGVLTMYEMIYMDQYRELGFRMLNLSGARDSPNGIKRSFQQRQKHADFLRGKPGPMLGKKHTEETKALIRQKRALQTNFGKPNITDEVRAKMSAARIGKPGLKGRIISPEQREKIRQKLLGRKLSKESIAKRTATVKENLKTKPRKGWPEEAKKKQSERYKGTKLSPERKQKISEALKKHYA